MQTPINTGAADMNLFTRLASNPLCCRACDCKTKKCVFAFSHFYECSQNNLVCWPEHFVQCLLAGGWLNEGQNCVHLASFSLLSRPYVIPTKKLDVGHFFEQTTIVSRKKNK